MRPTPTTEEWERIVRDAEAFGLLVGALEGLKWSVDEATRVKIDDIINRAKAIRKAQ